LRTAALILLVAVVVGFMMGLGRAWVQGRRYVAPPLAGMWLLTVAFLPQLFAFYLPMTSRAVTDSMAAVALVTSQLLLFLFGWVNRAFRPFWLLLLGLSCNLLVIVSNGGLMPISPATLAQLAPPDRITAYTVGERFGRTKDRLLPASETRFALFADRLVLPAWTGLRIAYSLGDVLIAAGACWFLWAGGGRISTDAKPIPQLNE
jgi:hypothetical protein